MNALSAVVRLVNASVNLCYQAYFSFMFYWSLEVNWHTSKSMEVSFVVAELLIKREVQKMVTRYTEFKSVKIAKPLYDKIRAIQDARTHRSPWGSCWGRPTVSEIIEEALEKLPVTKKKSQA